ncbi:MAG TPA: metallophosphoesterase family protein [Actinomycetota bacterium]|nr:metallophosphoesterase family protein [Actinomycetota bacterium]
MRIAVVSDIHGNLIALDAVMTDLESQSPDQVWCGGDLGWGGPWATDCIDRVRAAGWPVVKGNTDVWLTGDPQTIEGEEARAHAEAMAAAHNISQDHATWLAGLPLGHAGPGSMLLVHGTPSSPFTAPGPNSPAGDFAPYEGAASLVVYGHVHEGFIRKLADGTVVCNAGSVGLPKDGATACYLVIDHAGAEWTIRHRRVSFDRRAVVAQARQMGDPIASFYLDATGES